MWSWSRPLCPLILHFFVELRVVILHTKFDVSNFSHSRDIEAVPTFKIRSRDLGPLLSPNFTFFVKFNLFDILAKFCDDSFIGRQERRWSALHWLKLEVLPKKRFWAIKGGPLTLGTCPPNLVFVFTCVTHVPNSRKIGQKLWSLSWTKGLCGHTHVQRQTYTPVILYLSNAMNCTGQTKNKKGQQLKIKAVKA